MYFVSISFASPHLQIFTSPHTYCHTILQTLVVVEYLVRLAILVL